MIDSAALVAGLSMLSVTLFAITVFAAPWLIAQLPVDYFSRTTANRRTSGRWRPVLFVVRNLTGIVFLSAGIIMMVTPGPGIVALVLGMSLCEFPGRTRMLRQFARHPRVFSSLNWLRQRAQKPPFIKPD